MSFYSGAFEKCLLNAPEPRRSHRQSLMEAHLLPADLNFFKRQQFHWIGFETLDIRLH